MGEILGDIVGGRYDADGHLPREVDIAERHSVSRYVARECIQALRDRGVLTVTHGVGTTIAPQSEWNLFDGVLLQALLQGPGARSVASDALECRALLWPVVAALAAKRRTNDDLDRLGESVAEGDAAFGAALARAGRNRFLRRLLAVLEDTMEQSAPPAGGRRATARRRVLEAVRSGDEDGAREAMRVLAGVAPRRRRGR